jgi:hypothetical protein
MCTTYCSAIIVLAGITRFLSFCIKESSLPAEVAINMVISMAGAAHLLPYIMLMKDLRLF